MGERLFRIMLWAYPAAFRRRYRDDLIAFFNAERRSVASKRGLVRQLHFWQKTVADLIRAASVQRLAAVTAYLGRVRRSTRRPTSHHKFPMANLFQDVRHAGRLFVRNPGFTLIALATLATGIGINVTMFGIVDGVLVEDLPYPDGDRIVAISGADTDGHFDVSENERLRYRDHEVFAAFGTYQFAWVNLAGPDGAERIVGAAIDEGVLPALGVNPMIGRGFAEPETQPGHNSVVLLSYGLWQSRFGGDPTVLGTTISASGADATVIGVLPAKFRLPGDFVGPPVQLYTAQAFGEPDPRNIHYLHAVARLANGVSVEAARAQLTTLATTLKTELPTLPPTFRTVITPVREAVLGAIQPMLWLLFAAVGLLLGVACVNVANIFLARSENRRAEIALRRALGASRGRIVSQLMLESVVLSLVGGVLGLVVASVALSTVVRIAPANIPRIDQVGIDVTVVAFAAALSLLTALLFGTAPALTLAGREVRGSLHESGRSSTPSAGRNRIRRTLVVVQVALAMMLASGAGLLVRSFVRLQAVEPGISVDRILTLQTTLPFARYSDKESARSFYDALLDRVRSLPGVARAGAISALPLASDPGDWGIRIEGREEERLPSGRRPWADRIIVTDDYFETLDVPLVQGRTLERTDVAGAPEVVVINETAALRYWPGESAVGKRFRLTTDLDGVYRTVVGVTRDVKHLGLSTEVKPEMYLPYAQHPAQATSPIGTMNLVVKTTADPLALAESIRRQLNQIDSEVPMSNIRTMDDVLAASTAAERLGVSLFSVFGGLALLLVSVGVYGVTTYLVCQRAKELSIRMALGAAPSSVVAMVIAHGFWLALGGITAGVFGALFLGRLLSNMLFGVSWYDPLTLAVVVILVFTVTLAASAFPAWRATRVDPIRILRAD